MNPKDYPYCPRCGEGKYDIDVEMGICTDCGVEVQDEWPLQAKASHYIRQAIALSLAGAFLFGPFLVAAWRFGTAVLAGKPLWGFRAVEVTTTNYQPVGALSAALAPLTIGVLIWLVVIAISVGPRL